MYQLALGGTPSGISAFTMEGLDDLGGKKKKKKKKGKAGWLTRYKARKKKRMKLFKSGGPLARAYRKKKAAKKEKKLKARSIAINVGLFATKQLATTALTKKAQEIAKNPNYVVTTSEAKATKIGATIQYAATLYYVDKVAEAAADAEAEMETWNESETEAAAGAMQDIASEAAAEDIEGESSDMVQMMMSEAESSGEAKVEPKDLGLPTWAWVAIGAGGLAVVGGAAYVFFGRKK